MYISSIFTLAISFSLIGVFRLIKQTRPFREYEFAEAKLSNKCVEDYFRRTGVISVATGVTVVLIALLRNYIPVTQNTIIYITSAIFILNIIVYRIMRKYYLGKLFGY